MMKNKYNIQVEIEIPSGEFCGLCDYSKGILNKKCLIFNQQLECKEYPKFEKCKECKSISR